MRILGLFPTPVGIYDLDRSLSERELRFLSEQPQRPNRGNTTSEVTTVLDQPPMRRFRTWVQAQVDHFFKEVYSPANTDLRLRITQSWTNHTQGRQYHHKHTHPNSLISGVFYVRSRDDHDRIFFFHEPHKTLKIPAGDFNAYNSESWWLEARQNCLLLFPSHLSHMVEALPEDADTRISLSFNTFPVGDMGGEYELTLLHLKA